MQRPAAANEVYFAAEADAGELIKRLDERVKRHREWLVRTGRAARYLRSWSAYYGASVDGLKDAAAIRQGGENGEVALVTANLYATMVRQVHRLITGQKPAHKVIAKSSDAAAIAQTMLGDSLLRAYEDRALIAETETDAVLSGLLLGSGAVALTWATAEGEEVGVEPETGRVLHEGDVQLRLLAPWEFAFDVEATPAARRWVAYCYPANRYELAAQYPDAAAALLTAGGEVFGGDAKKVQPQTWKAAALTSEASEDSVLVWEFRHPKSPALRTGRLVRFVDADTVLYDSRDAGYPFPDLAVYEYAPERRLGRPAEGHTGHWDGLSLQEAMDVVTSALMSNANVGGLVNLWTQPGNAVTTTHLETGLNVVESATKPEVLDLLHLPPELAALLGLLRETMQSLMGLNDVAMGRTTSGMPAQLAALLEAKAVQFHQLGAAAYYRLAAQVRTGLLRFLQRFAKSPHVISVAGKSGAWALREWSADEVSLLDRVDVEPVNPVMRTFGGRMTLADQLAARGWVSKEEFLSVWLTGELHELLDSRAANLGRLAREKEMLMQGIGLPPVDMNQSMVMGEPVFIDDGQPHIRPLLTDKHWEDIPEYLSVLSSPEARETPAVVKAVTEAVQEKLRLWRMMPPDLLQLLGGPAPAMLAPPLPEEAEEKGEETGVGKLAGKPEDKPEMPKPPPNPLTAEQQGPPVA